MEIADVMKSLQDGFASIKATFEKQIEGVAQKITATHDEIKTYVDTELTKVKAQMETQKEQVIALATAKSLPGVESEKEKFSVARAACGVIDGWWENAGLEKEIYDNMRKRAHTAGDGSSGGYLIPTELADFIVEPAIAKMPIYGLGIRTLPGVGGVFEIPVLESRPDSGHTGENSRPVELNLTFGQKRMSPNRAAGYAKLSRRLLRMAGPGTEEFIRRNLQTSMMNTIHKALCTGTGANNQPIGILNTTGTTSFSFTANAMMTLKEARQMKTDLELVDFDQDSGSFGYLSNPMIEEGLLLTRTISYNGQTSGKGFLIQTDNPLDRKGLETRLGARLATSTHIPRTGAAGSMVSKVAYGDWSHFILALWAGMEINASVEASDATHNAFLDNLVMILAQQEYDVCVDLPAAFVIASDVAADRTLFTATGNY